MMLNPKTFFLFICILEVVLPCYGQQAPNLTASAEVSGNGHSFTWQGNLQAAGNKLQADFQPQNKKFLEKTERALSPTDIAWSPGIANHETFVRFNARNFSPLAQKPYPTFFSGLFKTINNNNPPPPLRLPPTWSAYSGLQNNLNQDWFFNVGRIPNPEQNYYKNNIFGTNNPDHTVSLPAWAGAIDTLNVQNYINNHLCYVFRPIQCEPGPGVTLHDLYTALVGSSGVLGCTRVDFADPIEMVTVQKDLPCSRHQACSNMVHATFYLKVDTQISPVIALPKWEPQQTPQQSSRDAWLYAVSKIKKHEIEHFKDAVLLFQEPFWKEWSHLQYVIEACYCGQTVSSTGNTAEDDVEKFLDEIKITYKKEYGDRTEYNKLYDAKLNKVGGILETYLKRILEVEAGQRIIIENGQQVPILGWGDGIKAILDKPDKL